MAWPSEAGILTVAPTPRRRRRRRSLSGYSGPLPGKYYGEARGKYRVYGTAAYRFYRSNTGPPAEDDTPFATNATLPHEPADTFADGTWYLAASYFNGLVDSGFLPLGSRGERYLRLDLSAGEVVGSPPAAPTDRRIEQLENGVVRVVGCYYESSSDRAGEWAIAYTTNGSDPPADTPDVTVAMPDGELAVLDYSLPAQGDGTTVKVRVQTRRNDGTVAVPDWVYSEGSEILTDSADASGPSAPLDAVADGQAAGGEG